MIANPMFSNVGSVALTVSEQALLQDLLDSHDRGGFYMAYNAMTDSAES